MLISILKGGVKAVVWTDFIQGMVIVGSAFIIAISGVHKVGGLAEVFARANAGGRLDIFK